MVSVVILVHVLTSEHSEQAAGDERKHVAFGFGLPYSVWSFLVPSISLQISLFNWSLRNSTP